MSNMMSFDPGYGRVRERLVEAIDEQLADAEARGDTLADLGDVDALVARVSAAIPRRHAIVAIVGSCFDTAGLVRWLGISKQALDKRRRSGAVLGCRTQEGHWVYPTFQFYADGRTIPHLRDLVTILTNDRDTSHWQTAQWLAAPSPDLPDGVSAATWLRDGGDPGPVLRAARADAARWAE